MTSSISPSKDHIELPNTLYNMAAYQRQKVNYNYNYISSANLPSDVMIKKVSTEKNFRTFLSKRDEWEREYTDYNSKENTVKW